MLHSATHSFLFDFICFIEQWTHSFLDFTCFIEQCTHSSSTSHASLSNALIPLWLYMLHWAMHSFLFDFQACTSSSIYALILISVEVPFNNIFCSVQRRTYSLYIGFFNCFQIWKKLIERHIWPFTHFCKLLLYLTLQVCIMLWASTRYWHFCVLFCLYLHSFLQAFLYLTVQVCIMFIGI